MKKIITFLSILIITTAFGQLTFVPDDNFEQALIDLGLDSPPLNNYVPTANISGVTTLDISNKDIFNLTGIGGFASLEYLDCSNNQLSSLNLTNNSNLQTLRCANNTITELDVTQNTNLQTLGCRDNNLRILTLHLNTSLQSLYCQNNNLIRINVKNGNNTNFTDFFATNNPDLICIQVDDVDYSTTNWTNIDLQTTFDENCNQYFTDVPDDNFEQALIDLGYDSPPLDDFVPTANIINITSLSVVANNITNLTGIEDFINLEILTCASNQLTTLDISQNLALQELNCHNNQLTSLDVSQNIALEGLSCYNNQLTTLDINQNIALQELNCSNNLLTSLDVSQNSNLSFLSCNNNLLTSLDVSQNSNLSYLSCSSNLLTSLDVKNGNNINIIFFSATNNPNLTCILVDDSAWSTANWANIDPTSTFVNNQAECTALSIGDNTFETQLNLYPNPVKNTFTIQNNSNYNIDTINIYTILGKLVLTTNNTTTPINVSNLLNGIYLVKINSNNKTTIKKIIINK